jgi:P-type Mg2+ transporter
MSSADRPVRPVPATGPTDAYWASPAADVLKALDSTAAGLSAAEAHARLQRSDTLAPHHRRTDLVLLLRQFANPVTLILVFATIVSAALGETTDATIILVIIVLSGLLSFWQEYAASQAVEDLLAAVHVTVEVSRDSVRAFVPAAAVVPGDVVHLDTGDLIPGDSLLLDADALLVDEATLTGESYPVEKETGIVAAETPLGRRVNCLFMGTHVVRGSASALVVHTADGSEFGRIARELERRPPTTRFERGLTNFGQLLLYVMVALVALAFLANVLLERP